MGTAPSIFEGRRTVQALSIMYHDVVARGEFDSSGFAGGGADIYKLEREEFAGHLEAIRGALGGKTVVLAEERWDTGRPLFLTFDDGGAGAHMHAAPLLEERGWRGHFFITTDRIGTPGFLSAEQIRDLDRRGHAIGSHSCSHPARIASCPWDELLREWTGSARRLADLLGKPVTLASVPGGYYTRRVGDAAAAAGLRTLFTSEPTVRVGARGECRILGRYAIWRGMPAARSGDLAAGRLATRWKQAAWWEIKRGAKRVLGERYEKARGAWMGQ